MIDRDNFRSLLIQIGFTKKGEVYERKISDAAAILKVEFKKQELMQNIKVPVPSLNEQRLFVSKIEALEKQIAAAQAVIDAAPARKEAVMKKYL